MNELRRPFASSSVPVSLRVQVSGDLGYGQSTALRGLPPQLSHTLDYSPLDGKMAVRLNSLNTLAATALAVPGGP